MFIRPDNKKAVIMQDKEALVKAHIFSLPLVIYEVKYQSNQGSIYS